MWNRTKKPLCCTRAQCPNMVLKFGFTVKIYLGTTSIVRIKNAVIYTDYHFHVGAVKNSFQIKKSRGFKY